MAKWFGGALVPIAIIYFANFFDFFLLEGFVIVHPSISTAHGWDEAYMTSVMSICKFTMMVTCPFVAFASSKVSAHNILIFGIVCLALSALGQALSHSYYLFAISKVAHGISSPAMMLSGMAILTNLSEKSTRGKYAAYGYAGIAHGLLVAPFLTGVLLEHAGQFWSYMLFFGLIVLNLICAVVHFHNIRLPWSSQSNSGDDLESVASMALFEPIKAADVVALLRIILSNPWMLAAVSSCFLVGISIGANESVLPVLLNVGKEANGLSDMTITLIWTSGSVTYTILAYLTGYFADRIAPIKLVFTGMVLFTITFALMPYICSSVAGVTSFIALTGGLTSFLDVAAYPLIASVVDTADIPNAYIIGYSIEYCLEQAAYAIGQYAGDPLSQITDSLHPVSYMVAAVDLLLIMLALFAVFVYPSKRFVRSEPATRATSYPDEEVKAQAGPSSVIALEEGVQPIHEQL